MSFNAGVTVYQKYKWAYALAQLSTLRLAVYSTTAGLDATQVPGSPTSYTTALVYTNTGELTGTATGYNNTGTAGTTGYGLSGGTASVSGSSLQITWTAVTTGTGTIAAGTYGGMIYDTADSNRVVAVVTISIATGSSSGTMTFNFPANIVTIS